MLRITMAAAVGAALAAAGAAHAQDYNLRPLSGGVQLQTGFTPDPVVVEVEAGGDIDASETVEGGACTGFITEAPTFALTYRAGYQFPLILAAQAEQPVSLVVNDPNTRWHCAAADENGVATLLFLVPASGRYDIWVGAPESSETTPAALAISELLRAPAEEDAE